MKTEINNSTEKSRLDIALVKRGLVPSRTLAVRLIEAGKVYLGKHSGFEGIQICKPAVMVNTEDHIYIEDCEENRFVSRGGIKLDSALQFFHVDVENKRILDVGISTGGFSDCVLQRGAKEVVGLDVGHDQLAEKLRNDSRVMLYEGVNARNLSSFTWLDPFDLILIDVSFISLTKVLPEVVKFLKVNGELLALIKPQFELGADALNKNGVVRAEVDSSSLKSKISEMAVSLDLDVMGICESTILGGDGNKEYFIHGRKKSI